MTGVSRPRPLATRLIEYQAERFPVLKHGVLIAAFGASAVCVSAMLRGATAPSPAAVATAVLVLFLLFFQLRVADEHKDHEDDARWRPERPVPRGLIRLDELRRLALAAGAVQVAAAGAHDWRLLALLLLVWGWIALMTAEFFVPVWLKSRPAIYMASHMAVMPLIDLFATACDWLAEGGPGASGGRGEFGTTFGVGLSAFLALSFLNGVVVEVGRKTWSADQEREGVDSYSRAWGREAAALVVAAAMAGGLGLAVVVHGATGAPDGYLWVLAAAAAGAIGCAARFAVRRDAASAKLLETASGLHVLAVYVLLGVAPAAGAAWAP